MAYLEAHAIGKSFDSRGGAREVLRDVSLSVDRGEFVSVVGAMGSGKSTLLGLLAGLMAPDTGRVTIGGEPVVGIRSDAAYVFQNYSLLPWLTALDNVSLAVGAACPRLSKTARTARAREALEQVGLASALSRRPGQLSGGMRQRVAIARAFATRPDVLFMDEPFGALDALTRKTLQQDLVNLSATSERRVTTVMITNSLEEAILLSDRIVPMMAGPPATLGAPLAVPLPRPRYSIQFDHDEESIRVRAQVVASLTAVLGTRSRHPARPTTPSALRLSLAAEEGS